jgi:sulfite exporter TauE/SafE
MTLLAAMLPIYLFGNLHCLGMCGPLVMMISKNRFRYFYFLGRLFSYTLAGLIAGELGAVLNELLSIYHIQALTSFLFGSLILFMGLKDLFSWKMQFLNPFIFKKFKSFNQHLSVLMLRDSAFATFLFGFFTVALPCGQTLLVFSACALSGSAFVGMLNGFSFALLTSPSLFFAMNAHQLLKPFKKHYESLIGVSALLVGFLGICRGLAEVGLIEHLTLGSHIVFY